MSFPTRVRRAIRFRSSRSLSRLLQPPLDERSRACVTIGRHTYPSRPRLVQSGTYSARLTIGSFCSIGPEVLFFLDSDHHTEWITTFPLRMSMRLPGAPVDGDPTTRGDIVVGNDVWIGQRASILSGVTIGDGAVVGAGAVVSRNIPPYAVAVGNPAVVTRMRFSEDQIAALLRIRWWEWPDDLIAERVDLLCSTRVGELIERFDTG